MCVLRGLQLPGELLDSGEFLATAGKKAVVLGELLVLHADGGDAGSLEQLHRIGDVVRIPVSRVAVRDDRNVDRLVHCPCSVEVLAHRNKTRVRNGKRR